MRLTRIKTTVMAGVMAASMLLPNMTAMAVTTATNGAEITKKVTAAADGVTFDETFTYTFAQEAVKEDSGVQANVNTATIGDVTINVKNTTDKRTATGGINLDDLKTPGVYTYIVEESARTATDPTGTTWDYDTTTQYRLRVYVSNGDSGLTKTMTLIKLNADDEDTGEKLTTAEFENKLVKTSTTEEDGALFTLTKAVTDNSSMEPANQEYEFKITVTPDPVNGTPTGGYTYKVGGETKTVTSGGTIKLKKGETASFTNISAGDKVTIEEVNNPANVKSVATSATVAGSTENGTNVKVENVLVDEGGSAVTYTNTWADVTMTGVVTSIAPYVTLVVVAIAAVAAYMAIKGRVAR